MQDNKNTSSNRNKILAIIFIPLAVIIAFVGGYFSRYLFDSKNISTASDVIRLMEQVGYIYDIRTGEKIELSPEQIADALVYSILDQYSAYYTAEEYKVVQENSKGNVKGIGVSFYDYDNIIDKIVFNSPAELAGIKKGDKIKKVKYAENVVEVTDYYSFAVAMQDLSDGQEFNITIERQNELLSFNLCASDFIASYVQYFDSQKQLSFRINEKGELVAKEFDVGMTQLDSATAYIELTEFNGGAGEQIKKALEYMKERGKTKLILDVRDNGGGYTNILEEIASMFIYNNGERKSLIGFADGKKYDHYFYTTGNAFNTDITSIAVLANENSASATECLIGAMLHYKDRFSKDNLIIEKNSEGIARTYGKGIMQTTYGLISGGALKLTTAQIFLPDKTTSIHGKGFVAEGANAVEKGEALNRAIQILS